MVEVILLDVTSKLGERKTHGVIDDADLDHRLLQMILERDVLRFSCSRIEIKTET